MGCLDKKFLTQPAQYVLRLGDVHFIAHRCGNQLSAHGIYHAMRMRRPCELSATVCGGFHGGLPLRNKWFTFIWGVLDPHRYGM